MLIKQSKPKKVDVSFFILNIFSQLINLFKKISPKFFGSIFFKALNYCFVSFGFVVALLCFDLIRSD